MRFFKYLIFLLSFFSVSAFSGYENANGICKQTPEEACSNYASSKGWKSSWVTNGIFCYGYDSKDLYTSMPGRLQTGCVVKPDECWHPDYKIVSQDVNNSQIKTSLCISNNGVMCKYVGSVKNTPVVNGYITTIFDSVSKTPDPNCKEDLANPPCDPKDPYGGCYTPPNQECTRQANGSIYCPEDKEPPIENTCNGADYCKRPPQGCGQGYVSGTWNGERICIKTSPSTGDNTGNDGDGSGSDGDGSGSGGDGSGGDGSGGDGSGGDGSGGDGSGGDGSGGDGSDADGSGGDGSGGNLPVTNDLSGVINAIKNIGSKLDHYSKEIIESIDSMSKKITGKLDTSNGHLDQIEANTLATKDNTDKTNDLLQKILDKDTSGAATGEYHGILDSINKNIEDIKEIFSGDGEQPEEHQIPMKELEKSSFVTDIIKVNAAYCPADKVINWQTPFGTLNKTISYQNLCASSAWLGYLFIVAAYLFAAHVVVRNS